MSNKVKVFVFVDALGWEQVEKYDFLKDLLPHRRKIEMQFGYSCTAIPTILTGKRPDEHGHLAFYDWAPARRFCVLARSGGADVFATSSRSS